MPSNGGCIHMGCKLRPNGTVVGMVASLVLATVQGYVNWRRERRRKGGIEGRVRGGRGKYRMGMEMEIVGYIEQEAGNRKEKERG